MKASLLLKQVLNKAGESLENRSELEAAIEKINFDLPDSFEAVVNGLNQLMTEQAAQSKPAVATNIINKYNDNLSKAHSSKMQGLGFAEAEIAELLQLPMEERLSKIVEINTRKIKSQYNLSESERVAQEEGRARTEKERADRIQAQLAEKDHYTQKQMESMREEYELRNLINTVDINNNLPHQDAYELIMTKVRNRLQAVGAKIISVHGTQRLVQASDEVLDFYDDRNNKVTPRQFIETVAYELNLLRPKNVAVESQRNTTAKFTYTPNDNSSANKPNGFTHAVDQIKKLIKV